MYTGALRTTLRYYILHVFCGEWRTGAQLFRLKPVYGFLKLLKCNKRAANCSVVRERTGTGTGQSTTPAPARADEDPLDEADAPGARRRPPRAA